MQITEKTSYVYVIAIDNLTSLVYWPDEECFLFWQIRVVSDLQVIARESYEQYTSYHDAISALQQNQVSWTKWTNTLTNVEYEAS
jgi:hypothetical protein